MLIKLIQLLNVLFMLISLEETLKLFIVTMLNCNNILQMKYVFCEMSSQEISLP